MSCAVVGRGPFAWLYGLFVGVWAQCHMSWFILRGALHVGWVRRQRWLNECGGWGFMKRSAPWIWRSAYYFLPRMLFTYTPLYSPHRVPMPERALPLVDLYTERATKVIP